MEAVANWGDLALAVRSSGVDEDLDTASFAGLYTTVLHVRGRDELGAAIRAVWESASSERVTAYLAADGSPSCRMAVLVQPMVDARAAGVAFTADPVTGARGVAVVEAVTGVGEQLGSGEVTPDEWEVSGGSARRRSTGPG